MDRVGPDDDFFALGGDSIVSIRAGRPRSFGGCRIRGPGR
ncbi:phosphopantetheine-binding protein [Streptomyces thinghirensis]|nr:phosphopantetheine-binding protein [Streptomyces thinghirensis]